MAAIWTGWCCLFVLTGVEPASAPAAASSDATPAGRAGDAAVQALIDAVLGEPAASRRRLSSELASVAEAERALRDFIAKTARTASRRADDDARMIGTAAIDTASLNSFLGQLAARNPYLLDARRLPLAAKSPELTAEALVDGADGPFDDRPGWRHCNRRAMALVRAAAAEDLRLNLLVSLSDLRVSADLGLGEWLAGDEAARRRLQAQMAGLPLPDPTLDPSGVCRVRLVLTRRQILSLLESSLRAGEAPDPRIDWPRLTAGVPATMAVDGYAVAPPSSLRLPATQPASP